MRPALRAGRRAGLTLVEAAVAVGIVGLLTAVLAGALVTSTAVSRDVWVEEEVVRMAGRTVDTLADELSRAGRFTDAWDLSQQGDQLELQHRWCDQSGQVVHGAELPLRRPGEAPFGAEWADRHRAGWAVRAVWVAEGQPIREASPLGSVDVNGDGDTNDVVACGHIELRYYTGTLKSGAAIEQTGLRRQLGGGAVRIVQAAFAGAATPRRLFARPPVTALATGVDTPRRHRVVRTEADTTPGGPSPEYPEVGAPADPSVQLDLRVVYNPVPTPGGQRQVRVLDAVRLVAKR